MAEYNSHGSFFRDKSIDKYLGEISNVPLLKPEEEVNLAIRIKQGDRRAFSKLIQANLRFVVSVAKDYQNQGLPFGDLINEGNVGLIKAAQRFDETKGFKFISYAVWWIRQSILQALAEHARVVRLPLNKVGSLNRMGKACNLLEQEFEREPTIQEIANAMDISPSEVAMTYQLSGKQISLDAPLREGEANSLIEILENYNQNRPDEKVLEDSLKLEIKKVMNSLAPKEAEVLRMYFGLDMDRPLTLDEIGKQFRLTRERVRQIKERAIARLRHKTRSKTLRQYLG